MTNFKTTSALVLSLVCSAPRSAAQLPGAFTATGSMTTPRSGHTATLLGNGKVLIAGGSQIQSIAGQVLASAELYDPSTSTFSLTGSTLPINASTLTLLADGKALIQGTGEDGFISAALYDPETGAVRLDGEPITEPWTIVTATLVASGKLLDTTLVTDEAWPTGVAELYDPSIKAFAPRKMAELRRWPTATLMPDSTVLIAGGGNSGVDWWTLATSGAELYDPAADQFSVTGSMAENRERHTATLLPDGTVLVAGGGIDGFGTATAEIYHPNVLIPAAVLFSLSGDGRGQGAIWHAATGQVASANNPTVTGEILSMFTTSLFEGGVIPPQVAIGGQLAEILFFGDAPGYRGYFQVNFRVPNGVAPGSAVPVRLTYIGRPSNAVTIEVQ